jgi:hypothetical protein
MVFKTSIHPPLGDISSFQYLTTKMLPCNRGIDENDNFNDKHASRVPRVETQDL